tara:strand:- start:334 stop:930 length:597 start_codon:yes stop_codon:yes gene_type:complete
MGEIWLNKNNWNDKDEYYTPSILVEPILKYLKPNSTIWCPFDTKESEFVILFKEAGHKVIYSHIWLGQDFFEYEPDEHYDYIISNPPFTKKYEILDRLYELDKPFAMILGIPVLNYQVVGEYFFNKQREGIDLQLLIVDKKISFDGNTASFNNSFFCYNVLPKQIIFEHLAHNNSRTHFIPSRMMDSQRLYRYPQTGY